MITQKILTAHRNRERKPNTCNTNNQNKHNKINPSKSSGELAVVINCYFKTIILYIICELIDTLSYQTRINNKQTQLRLTLLSMLYKILTTPLNSIELKDTLSSKHVCPSERCTVDICTLTTAMPAWAVELYVGSWVILPGQLWVRML